MLPFMFQSGNLILVIMSEVVDQIEQLYDMPPAPVVEAETQHRLPRFRQFAGRVLLGICGATGGFLLTPAQDFSAGPIEGQVSFEKPPALNDGTTIDLSLLGSIDIPTHIGPSIRVSMTDIKSSEKPEAIADELESLDKTEDFQDEIAEAVKMLGLKGVLYSLAGVGVVSAGGYLFSGERRRLSHSAKTGIAGTIATIAMLGALPVVTYDKHALDSATYHGLASFAPEYIGDTDELLRAYPGNIQELGNILDYLGQLRNNALEGEAIPENAIGVLAVSDIHCLPGAYDFLSEIIKADPKIKFMLDAGDMTDHGTVAENQVCFQGIDKVGVPVVAIQGNHDSSSTKEYLSGLDNVTVLDSSSTERSGLSIYGIGDKSYTPSVDEDGISPHDAQEYSEIPVETDILLAHRPKTAEQHLGEVGLAISGDTHELKVDLKDNTLYVNPGTTGAAFLRAYATDKPAHRTAAIIYIDPSTKKPIAVSQLDLGEIGDLSLNVKTCFVQGGVQDATLEC